MKLKVYTDISTEKGKDYPRVRLRIAVVIYRKLNLKVNIGLPKTFQLNEQLSHSLTGFIGEMSYHR